MNRKQESLGLERCFFYHIVGLANLRLVIDGGVLKGNFGALAMKKKKS